MTRAQKEALRIAAIQGAAFPVPIRQRKGGSYSRMIDRMVLDGYFYPRPPYKITAKGRKAVSNGQ